jgi:hypothetical protein
MKVNENSDIFKNQIQSLKKELHTITRERDDALFRLEHVNAIDIYIINIIYLFILNPIIFFLYF